MGRLSEVTASYNGLSQKGSEVRPLGRNLSWTWSVHGEVLTETDARGHTTSHVYDSLGRRTESTDPIGTRSWDLDNAGNVLSETDRLGRTTSYTYDNLDRRITQTDPAPPATTQSWTYSANNMGHTETVVGESRTKGVRSSIVQSRDTCSGQEGARQYNQRPDPHGCMMRKR